MGQGLVPFLGALGTIALAASPSVAQELARPLVLPVGAAIGMAFVGVGVSWRGIVLWAYGPDAAPQKTDPNMFESIDLRFWSFVDRLTRPAFIVLGIALPTKFWLASDPLAESALQLSGMSLLVVVAAWFAPLWVRR